VTQLRWYRLLILLALTHNSNAWAQERINIHGFMTTAVTQTKNNQDSAYANGTATDKTNFSARDNVLGLQIKADIDESTKLTTQFIARGDDSNYDLKTDWAYLDIKAGPHSNIHVGRYKIPLFIASDYIDVSYSYPWVRPPQEVYSSNPLISHSGINWLYNIPLHEHNILIQLYYGNGSHDVYIPSRSLDLGPILIDKTQTLRLNTRDSVGINVGIQSKLFSFRAGHFKTKVDVNGAISGAKGDFTGIGFSLDADNMVVYSEYVSRDTDSNVVVAFPDQTAWYITLGYKLKTYLPYITYAHIGPGMDENILSVEQTSTAAGIRYDFGKNSAFKLEALYIDPADNNHGLFHDPVENGTVYTGSLNVIF